MGIWMVLCHNMVFIAMLQYGYILYQVKFNNKINVINHTDNEIKSNQSSLDDKILNLDKYFLIVMPVIFIICNIVFWATVKHFTSKND